MKRRDEEVKGMQYSERRKLNKNKKMNVEWKTKWQECDKTKGEGEDDDVFEEMHEEKW